MTGKGNTIHRDELAAIREVALADATGESHSEGELLRAATILRLLNHIDAMRDHECFYKWSAVKAERHGGPPATCSICGYESLTRQASSRIREANAALEDFLRNRAEWLSNPTVPPVIADGTQGMRRGE